MANIDLDKGGRIPQIVKTNVGPTLGWKMTDAPIDIEYVLDGGGIPIVAGYKGSLIIPDWCVVNNWVLLSDLVGSIVIDVWKIPLATYLAGTVPNSGNSITGTDIPTLSSQVARQSTLLTGWTTQINQNDVLAFNVNSASGVQRVSLILQCVRIIGQS